jgi:16S rRNA (guanine966-N2)-methyltransferase
VRIVGGSHRGRRLLSPAGEAVRPTSDRAREALFNILSHGDFAAAGLPFADRPVLDAFAGTGAFGLEALSRGASAAAFIENGREALSALRRNIAALGEEDRAHVVSGDATRPPRAAFACALAFLDPPYHSGLAAAALPGLAAAGWLTADALAIVEVAAREELPPPAGFSIIDKRTYGAARLVFLRRQATAAEDRDDRHDADSDAARRRARAGLRPGHLAHGGEPPPRRRRGGRAEARHRSRHDADRHRRDVR